MNRILSNRSPNRLHIAKLIGRSTVFEDGKIDGSATGAFPVGSNFALIRRAKWESG